MPSSCLSKLLISGKPPGKNTYFKWLLGYRADDPQPAENYIGKYSGISISEPRFAIYADQQGDIIEILTELAQDPRWMELEKRRREIAMTRRPGVSALTVGGQEYRTLNYGNKQGYSETQAANPFWRQEARGDVSIRVQSPDELRDRITLGSRRLDILYTGPSTRPALIALHNEYVKMMDTNILTRNVNESWAPTDADWEGLITSLERNAEIQKNQETVKRLYNETDLRNALRRLMGDHILVNINSSAHADETELIT